ncbi:hypothetical protein DFH09DRAFT_1097028 [Mycena vulgaris]|nr:hypothetical protein DFH09DRAFT_1097028 [Mycena vulgaris]
MNASCRWLETATTHRESWAGRYAQPRPTHRLARRVNAGAVFKSACDTRNESKLRATARRERHSTHPSRAQIIHVRHAQPLKHKPRRQPVGVEQIASQLRIESRDA